MGKITSNAFTKCVKSGDFSLVRDYAAQLGIDASVMERIAEQIVKQRNGALRVRTNSDGFMTLSVMFDEHIFGSMERVGIYWKFNRSGICYAVYNEFRCK